MAAVASASPDGGPLCAPSVEDNNRLVARAVAGMINGGILHAVGMFRLSTMTVDSFCAFHVMPALFLTSFGLGLGFVPLTLTAVPRVAEDRAR